MGKAHVVALNKDGEVFTFGMNNKGQCGRDFPGARGDVSGASGAAMSSPFVALAGEGLEDVNSDHDIEPDRDGMK